MATAASRPHNYTADDLLRHLHRTHMPATRRKAAESLQASSSRSVRRTPVPPEVYESVVLRYEKHQDTIPVNSVEEESNRRRLLGYKHYQHMMNKLSLNLKPSLDHIDYRDRGGSRDTVFAHSPSPCTLQKAPADSHPPSPPSATAYHQTIYSGTTHNPAIFLSILRIAQHNLPRLDLSSALNHLPNTHPADTLPRLHPSAPGNLAPRPFIDATPLPKRPHDARLNIAFLPAFYSDARHSIGYFEILRGSHGSKKVGACLFTPCTEEDLRRYGMVEYLQGREEEGVEGMRRVGARQGCWLDKDTVEEYEEWILVWRVVRRVWEGRLGFARGELEG